jgi:hypothetical protein
MRDRSLFDLREKRCVRQLILASRKYRGDDKQYKLHFEPDTKVSVKYYFPVR